MPRSPSTAKLDQLLARLWRVQEDGYAAWRACCPSCRTHHLALEIRFHSDGLIELHCHRCGAPAWLIVRLCGLPPATLVPPRGALRHAPAPGWWREPPRYAEGPGAVPPVGER